MTVRGGLGEPLQLRGTLRQVMAAVTEIQFLHPLDWKVVTGLL